MLITDLHEKPVAGKTSVTIGTYDGVHLGHRMIIEKTCLVARQKHLQSAVVTFEPHPQTILHLDQKPPIKILTTIQEKSRILQQLGVDILAVLPFDKTMSELDGVSFIRTILVEKLQMKHCVIGHDHAFGKNRTGNIETLRSVGAEAHFAVEQISALKIDDKTVNSTLIRRFLLDGSVEQANEYLGRPYSLQGVVAHGDGRGAALGLPTANLFINQPDKLIPQDGVYVTNAVVDGRSQKSVTNIGARPTFDNGPGRHIEVHLLGFEGDLYGKTVTVQFLKFLRSEMKFENSDQLVQQIRADIEVAVNYHFSMN